MDRLGVARNVALIILVISLAMAPGALTASSDPECETWNGEYEGEPYFCIVCTDDSHLNGVCEPGEGDYDPDTGSCNYIECVIEGENQYQGECYDDPACDIIWVED